MGSESIQTVVAEVRAKAEFVEEVKRACLALVEPSRADKGCLSYDLYQSNDDPAIFIFFETWESREDIERHLESSHSLAFDDSTAGMLAGLEDIVYLEKLS
jgi:quinol monooxygenase YgiN